MDTKEIFTAAVVGAGTMGQSIAHVLAFNGYTTLLYDKEPSVLKNALNIIERNIDKGIERGKIHRSDKKKILKNIQLVNRIDQIKADLIIEAVVENLEVKQQIFKSLEENNASNAILATNTSSISISKIASVLQHPERFIGLHFFNPAHVMRLVEIIAGVSTPSEFVAQMSDFIKKLGKEPVIVKDVSGFIVNRVARHFYVESLKIVEENVADFETVDKLVENYGFKMGPFRLMDLIGVDANLSVTQSMFEAFNYESKFRPSKLQEQKVIAGHHGKKSGKGFYDYPDN